MDGIPASVLRSDSDRRALCAVLEIEHWTLCKYRYPLPFDSKVCCRLVWEKLCPEVGEQKEGQHVANVEDV